MKVLHLTGWPIPETVGGTEVYVESLCRALAGRGTRCAVGFPDARRPWTVGEHGGLPLHRFLPGAGPGDDFRRWLDDVRPDVVHVHSITEGLALPELQAVSRAGYPLVLTAHLPSVVCHRGTMVRDGRAPCDGQMRPERCGPCTLQKRGLPAAAGRLLWAAPRSLREGAAAVLPRRAATALRMPALLGRWHQDQRQCLALAARVVAVCRWLLDALRLNGVPEGRLFLSRQATALPDSLPPRRVRRPGEPLRLGYLGRFDPVKGLDVLVRAVAGLPAATPVRLTLRGLPYGEEGARYLDRLRRLGAKDARVEIGPPLPRGELAAFLAGLDFLAVPSTWLETGPIVVYEALAHRVPVLGSRLGGIAELVRDGTDGWLLPPGDVRAWRRRVAELAAGGRTLPPADAPSPVLRDWAAVAAEMDELYSQVLGRPAAAPCDACGPA